jgi:hypothetical protein
LTPLKILTGPADWQGCGIFRILLPYNAMARAGAAIVHNGRMTDVRDYDFLITQRPCNEPETDSIQRYVRASGRTFSVVLDLDDDLFHIDPANDTPFRYWNADRKRRLRQNIEVADLVTVSTEPLYDLLYPWNDSVTVLPNMVDGQMLTLEHQEPEHFTIGFGGSYAHQADWMARGDGISQFLRQNKDAELLFAGSDFSRFLNPDVQAQITLAPWSDKLPVYYRRMAKFTVGLAPLADTPFNLSKSDLRILEFSALGLPWVASAVGPYLDWADSGAGFLAHNDDDWNHYLTLLKNDPELRAAMGKRGRELAATRTVNQHWVNWYDALTMRQASNSRSSMRKISPADGSRVNGNR